MVAVQLICRNGICTPKWKDSLYPDSVRTWTGIPGQAWQSLKKSKAIVYLQLGDHTTRAAWLGKQGAIKPELLRKMDKDSAARGLSEEEIIWAVHSH